ncbi:MAG: hypothetical protein MHM6MM_000264 [Cercozoa sp. M6MM]
MARDTDETKPLFAAYSKSKATTQVSTSGETKPLEFFEAAKIAFNEPHSQAGFLVVFLALLKFLYEAFAISQPFNTPHGESSGLDGVSDEGAWIPGRKIDLADSQWRHFRNSIPLLVLGVLVFTVLSRACRVLDARSKRMAGELPKWRMRFYLLVSAGMCSYVFGAPVMFMLTIACVTFAIGEWSARAESTRSPLLTWTFVSVVMFCNERYNGYSFGSLLGQSFAWLDEYRGEIPWHWLFNLVVLRMISFNVDRHWVLTHREETDSSGRLVTFARHCEKCKHCANLGDETGACLNWRTRAKQDASMFTLPNFLAYCFYAPLLLTGPTVSFSAWISQVKTPQRTMPKRAIFAYCVRVATLLLAIEVFTHFLYMSAISHRAQHDPALLQKVAGDFIRLQSAGFLELAYLWLKFTVIWRFSRAWALLDGIEAPENMLRCFADHLRVSGFWRTWHTSFNLWLVRYVYVPLGGSGKGIKWWRRVVNVFVVFVFVAMWHDMTMQLLTWGLMMAVAIAPEVLLVNAVYGKKGALSKWRNAWFIDHLRAVGAYVFHCLPPPPYSYLLYRWFNTNMLSMANLIGYGYGLKGLQVSLQNLNVWHVLMWNIYLLGNAYVCIGVRRMEKLMGRKMPDH